MKRFTLAVLLIAIIFTSVLPVMADELTNAKNRKASADNRIAQLKKQQQEELKEKEKFEKQKDELVKQQNQEENAIEELEKQIADAKEHLRQTELALAQAVADYNQMNELVRTRLQVMYKNSKHRYLTPFSHREALWSFMETSLYEGDIGK